MITFCIGNTIRLAVRLATLMAMPLLPTTIAQAAGPLDGKYSGTRTDLNNGDGSVCAKTGPFSLTVTDNQFEYTYNRQLQVVLRPTIAADGSFSARQEYMLQRSSWFARIKGRVDAGTLVAEVEGTRCQYRLELKKQ